MRARDGRIWTVYFSERIESPATVKAVELVRAGAIGRPLQTVGLGLTSSAWRLGRTGSGIRSAPAGFSAI